MQITAITYDHLSKEQRLAAVQRLTALWAFSESGLGGAMHALQIPFTGLLVGGLAVIIITLIAHFSEQRYSQVLQSLLIVLMIKALISPYTPPPAYIAVAFQALAGFVIFKLFSINFFSILLLSVLAMLESAVQKLLVLTLFFGKSIWKAADELLAFITKQFNMQTSNGSSWIVTVYLLIYLIGGICIAIMAYRTIKTYGAESNLPLLNEDDFVPDQTMVAEKKKKSKGLWLTLIILAIISILLFVFAADTKQGWLAVLKTMSWTCTVMLIWYLLITPLFGRFIRYLLQKKQGSRSSEIFGILSHLPVMQQLAVLAWQKSSSRKGWRRLNYFLLLLIHWSLIYTGEPVLKKTV